MEAESNYWACLGKTQSHCSCTVVPGSGGGESQWQEEARNRRAIRRAIAGWELRGGQLWPPTTRS